QLRFFGDWVTPIVLVLVFYSLLVGLDPAVKQRLSRFLPLMTVLLSFVAYFLVYIEIPHDLQWHLGTSLDRLLMQLWPSALFAFFVVLNSPENILCSIRKLAPSTGTRFGSAT